LLSDCGLTACVTGAGAGVDSAWEQKKLEARKMLGAKRGVDPRLPKHSEGVHALLGFIYTHPFCS